MGTPISPISGHQPSTATTGAAEGEALQEDVEQPMNLHGQQARVRDNNKFNPMKQIFAAAESSGLFQAFRTRQKKVDKKRKGEKKSDEKESGKDTAEARVGGVAKVAAIEATRENKKRKDPFFKYRRLSKEKNELLEQQKKSKNVEELTNKINAITEEMEELYNTHKLVIDFGTEINATVEQRVQDLNSRGANLNEFDVYERCRDAVLDYGTVKDTYFNLMEVYKEDNLEEGIRITINDLAKDLNKVESQTIGEGDKKVFVAIDKYRLRLIMQELYKMKNLYSFYLTSKEKFSKYASEDLSVSKLMGQCLNFMEKSWVDEFDVKELYKQISVKKNDPMIASFLNNLLAVIKSMPHENMYAVGIQSNDDQINAVNSSREKVDQEKTGMKMADPRHRG